MNEDRMSDKSGNTIKDINTSFSPDSKQENSMDRSITDHLSTNPFNDISMSDQKAQYALNNNNIVRASTVGLSPNNTGAVNKTALDNVLASSIKTLVFDEDTEAIFRFAGDTILPNDFRVVFYQNNRWGADLNPSQDSNIVGGIIDAPDTAYIFDTDVNSQHNLKVQPYGFANGYATIHMWGSFPDLNRNETPYIQRALDYIIDNTRIKKLVVALGGDYKVSKLLAARWHPQDGIPKSSYVTFALEGTSPTTNGIGGVRFLNSDPQSFTIGVQSGLNVIIRNISFNGASPSVNTNISQGVDFIEWTDAQWLQNGAVRNDRYSPHTAIAIDPFNSGVPYGNRYPGWEPYYQNQPGDTGTSNFTIEFSNFYNFAVAIMESSSGSPNGDNVVFKNGFAYNCRTFWGCGNLQARANQIENLYVLGGMKFLVNSAEYGTQQGSVPEVKNSSLNSIKYLYFIGGTFSGISFNGCYGENLWSFGRSLSDLPVTFNTCQFNFRYPFDGKTTRTPMVLSQGGGSFNFIGGKLEYPRPDPQLTAYLALPFDHMEVNFIGSTIRTSLPFQISNERFDQVNFEGVTLFANDGGTYVLADNAHTSGKEIEKYYNTPFLPGSVGADYYFPATYQSVGKKFAKEVIESTTIVFDSSDDPGGCHFITTKPDAYQFGDSLYFDYPLYDNFLFFNTKTYASGDLSGNQGALIGFVSSVDKTNHIVRLKFSPDVSSLQGVVAPLSIIRIPRMQSRIIGSTTTGSYQITNAKIQTKDPVAMSFIRGAGLAPGTRVASVNGSTINLTQAAIANTENVQFYDAEVNLKYNNYPVDYYGDPDKYPFETDRVWYKGDEIFNVDANAHPNVRSWFCIKEGYLPVNSSLPSLSPIFTPQYP